MRAKLTSKLADASSSAPRGGRNFGDALRSAVQQRPRPAGPAPQLGFMGAARRPTATRIAEGRDDEKIKRVSDTVQKATSAVARPLMLKKGGTVKKAAKPMKAKARKK